MTDCREFFNTFALVPSYWPVKGIADSLCQVKGICDIQIQTRIGGEWNDGKLNGILNVPDLRKKPHFSWRCCGSRSYFNFPP
jgi:hypothetical protein